MKKFMFLFVALSALLFAGCQKGEYDSVRVDGKNIAGMWAFVAEEYQDEYYNYEDEVDTILIIDGKKATIYYHPEDYFEFRDGYIYGTSLDEFETDEEGSYTIVDDYLTIYGIPMMEIDVENGRLALSPVIGEDFFDGDDYTLDLERLKGFKE